MSHVATNWAFAQRGLKPASKLVLLTLADRHNPDHGCFPKQSTIAFEVNLSRSAVNAHLAELERLKLIRRVRRFDPSTNRQKPTRYILAFEEAMTPYVGDPCPETRHGDDGDEPCPETAHGSGGDAPDNAGVGDGEPCSEAGHGAVSCTVNEPCPADGTSRVQNLDSYEPVSLTTNPTSKARGARGGVDFLEEFISAHPNAGEREAVSRAWDEALEAGADPAALVVAARGYVAAPEVQRGYPKKAQNWLRDGAWRTAPAGEKAVAATIDDRAEYWADLVKAGRVIPSSCMAPAVGRRMVERGLVEASALRALGWSV